MFGYMTPLRLAAVLVAAVASAQTDAPQPVPGWTLSGSNRKAYEALLDRETFHGGAASAMIRCRQKSCAGFGALLQSIQTDEYSGQRVRLSGWVKAEKGGQPRLWMRVDGEHGEMLTFDNMDNRAKNGPFDWRRQEIVLDVPPQGALIYFGLIKDGGGAAWVDDLALEVVPPSMRSTNTLHGSVPTRIDRTSVEKAYRSSPPRPRNLDFEER